MNGHSELFDQKVEFREEEKRKWERKGSLCQMVMCLCANFANIGPACAFGYSAVALPYLLSPDSDLRIDENQASWIASITAMVTPVGCMMCGFILRRGRKLSFLLISAVSTAGWLTLFLATNYGHLLIGRAISGLAIGLASVSCTVYSAEVSSPKWRSIVVTWTSISIALGVLFVYIFGYFLPDNWQLVALLCGLFSVVSFFLTITVMIESPIWLRERGRMDEAIVALKVFRGIPQDEPLSTELLIDLKGKPQQKKQNVWKHLMKRTSVIPFLIMLGFFFFQQFSGLFVLIFYAVDLTREAGVKIDAYLATILIGLTRLIGSILVMVLSGKYGRRLPAILSGVGMSLCMGLLSIYLFFEDRGYSMGDYGVIPVICIVMYIFMSTMGFLVLPFAMIGELYPAKVKDILSGLTTCTAYIFSFIAIKTYPDLLAGMGKHGVFCFYGVISLLGTIFVVLFLPETKGKTLREIEEMYAKKKPTDDESVEKIIPMNGTSKY